MTKALDGKKETASTKDTLNAVASANGGNIEPLKKDVRSAYDRITKLQEERKAINDKIGSVRSDLQAKGIHKTAFDMALKYMNMDPDKREGFDIAYDIVRDALGEPVQGALDLETQPAETEEEKS